jgi:cold shock CspA family protein
MSGAAFLDGGVAALNPAFVPAALPNVSAVGAASSYYGTGAFAGNQRLSGVIKFFKGGEGWGMIRQDNGDVDYFVHRRHCVGDCVKEGDRVSFLPSVDGKTQRPMAIDVEGGTDIEATTFWGCYLCGSNDHFARDCPSPYHQ